MTVRAKITGRFWVVFLVGALLIGCGDSTQTATPTAAPAANQPAEPVKHKPQNPTHQTASQNSLGHPNALMLPRQQGPAFSARRDPFVPLVESEADPLLTASEPRYRRRFPQTALETIALDQLKLTSTFRSRGEPKALLEESEGKGHIVEIGTHLGLRGGRVAQILKDRVIVVEQTERSDGRVDEHHRDLQLQYDTQEEPEPSESSVQ